MDREQQRIYYNLCNPEQPIAPDSARNVDLDHFGDPDQPVRGLNWVERLATSIEFSIGDPAIERPACVLFTGLPGSGKSTELLRLKQRLQRPDGANLLTVYLDAEQLLNLTDEIGLSDIRIALLYETERRVLLAEGRSEDEPMKDGVFERLVQFLEGIRLGGSKEGISVLGTRLPLEMRVQPGLRQDIRQRVAAQTTAFLQKTADEFILLRERAVRCGYRGIVVLFDSLEKLRGNSDNFAQVLNSAERLFSDGAPYLRLPVHVVYTIPPALILRLRCEVEFMPMIKLWERGQRRRRFEPGFEAARSILRKRVPPELLRWFFGAADQAQFEARQDQIIEWSAGYPRELIRLLRSVILQAPLTDARLRRILGQAGDDYRRLLLRSDFEWLARVALEHDPLPLDAAQRQAADRMFANNVVLRYQNDREWYDVHPAVLEMPALQAEMARLRAPVVGSATGGDGR